MLLQPHQKPCAKSIIPDYFFFFRFLQVVGVLLVILSTNDTTNYCPDTAEPKAQRHFNRAMAMRSLKGLPPRQLKHKKYY